MPAYLTFIQLENDSFLKKKKKKSDPRWLVFTHRGKWPAAYYSSAQSGFSLQVQIPVGKRKKKVWIK